MTALACPTNWGWYRLAFFRQGNSAPTSWCLAY